MQVEDLVVHRVADQRRVPVSPQTLRDVQMAAQRELIGQLGGEAAPERWVKRIRMEFRRAGVPLRESPQRPVLLGFALADHVQLVVEDEQVLRKAVGVASVVLEHLIAIDLEERAVDFIHPYEAGYDASS